MSSKSLIPKALTYSIRQALDALVPADEIYLFACHADVEGMSWLMSLRANAGLAERLSSDPAGAESHA